MNFMQAWKHDVFVVRAIACTFKEFMIKVNLSLRGSANCFLWVLLDSFQLDETSMGLSFALTLI